MDNRLCVLDWNSRDGNDVRLGCAAFPSHSSVSGLSPCLRDSVVILLPAGRRGSEPLQGW